MHALFCISGTRLFNAYWPPRLLEILRSIRAISMHHAYAFWCTWIAAVISRRNCAIWFFFRFFFVFCCDISLTSDDWNNDSTKMNKQNHHFCGRSLSCRFVYCWKECVWGIIWRKSFWILHFLVWREGDLRESISTIFIKLLFFSVGTSLFE